MQLCGVSDHWNAYHDGWESDGGNATEGSYCVQDANGVRGRVCPGEHDMVSSQAKRGLRMVGMDKGWLYELATTQRFFKPCPNCADLHAGRDVLVTYLDLDEPNLPGLCNYCKHSRAGHTIIQVRRSTYHEVVKISDISRLTDISGIQNYVINSSKVLFLRPRPQPKPAKGISQPAKCRQDGRQLMDDSAMYCSLRCKLEAEDPEFAALAPDRGAEPYVPRRKPKREREEEQALLSVRAPATPTYTPQYAVSTPEDKEHLVLPKWGRKGLRYSRPTSSFSWPMAGELRPPCSEEKQEGRGMPRLAMPPIALVCEAPDLCMRQLGHRASHPELTAANEAGLVSCPDVPSLDLLTGSMPPRSLSPSFASGDSSGRSRSSHRRKPLTPRRAAMPDN